MYLSSKERLRLVEENRAFAFIVLDRDGLVAHWNKGAERLLGYYGSEVLGRHLRIFFTEGDRAMKLPERELDRVRAEGRSEDDNFLVRKDGTRVWVHGITMLAEDSTRTVLGFGKLVIDASASRAATEEAEQLRERLRMMSLEAHHRIKNSFQILSSLLQLKLAAYGAEGAVPLDEVEKLLFHVKAIGDLHEKLARDAKEAESPRAVNVRESLEKLIPLFEEVTGIREVVTRLDDVWVPVRLGTTTAILVNELLMNARKHGDGRVRLELEAMDGRARLLVSDSGAGFPAGFDPHSSRSLGLQLIESLVHFDLSGDVTYENGREGGAEVTITFPTPPVEPLRSAGNE